MCDLDCDFLLLQLLRCKVNFYTTAAYTKFKLCRVMFWVCSNFARYQLLGVILQVVSRVSSQRVPSRAERELDRSLSHRVVPRSERVPPLERQDNGTPVGAAAASSDVTPSYKQSRWKSSCDCVWKQLIQCLAFHRYSLTLIWLLCRKVKQLHWRLVNFCMIINMASWAIFCDLFTCIVICHSVWNLISIRVKNLKIERLVKIPTGADMWYKISAPPSQLRYDGYAHCRG